MKEFYSYCPETFVYLCSISAGEQPEYTSEWPPPTCESGQQAYFTGTAWIRCLSYQYITSELLKQVHLDLLQEQYVRETRELDRGVHPSEVKTYDVQYAEAKHFRATGEALSFLATLSEVRGETPAALANKILTKASPYQKKRALILGQYQMALKAAESVEEYVLTQNLLQSRVLQQTPQQSLIR